MWFDNLIPAGIWQRGVEEMHEDFDGFPLLTTFMMFCIVIAMIMLAVSVDSMVIRKTGGAIGSAVRSL